MEWCPICPQIMESQCCTVCGYDPTLDHERRKIGAVAASLSTRKQEWQQIGNRLLYCGACGSARLLYLEDRQTFRCSMCGKTVVSPSLEALQEKLRSLSEAAVADKFLPTVQGAALTEEKYLISLSIGDEHIAGLWSDGTPFVAGDDLNGQLQVSKWKGLRKIYATKYCTYAICTDGRVLATKAIGEDCDVSTFQDVVELAVGKDDDFVVALKPDGSVLATGRNMLFEKPRVEDWDGITAIAAGWLHILGLRKNGTVVTTGGTGHGKTSIWRNIIAIGAGWDHSVGLTVDGIVLAAGGNDEGQCNVKNWKNIKKIAVGSGHTVGLREDGTVLATGDNFLGQCDVETWKDVVEILAGYDCTLGIQTDGTLLIAGCFPGSGKLQEIADRIKLQ